MADLQQYPLRGNALPIAAAISSEKTIASGNKHLLQIFSYGNLPHNNTNTMNFSPLQFGKAHKRSSSVVKQLIPENGPSPLPGDKTPKEKTRICFGTPLQRQHSKQSL